MINYIKNIAKIEKQARYNAIVDELSKMGIKYRVETLPYEDAIGNIIVELNPSKLPKIVLCAHYDNVAKTPGANDNATACAILLNFIKNYKGVQHIEVVFFDLEERHLLGSSKYVKTTKNISFALNLDMCGIGDNILLTCDNFDEETPRVFEYVFKKYNITQIKSLPDGDAKSFVDKGIKTLYVVSSTTHDLKCFDQYSKTGISIIRPDFLKTMHSSMDTVDTLNIEQIDKVYNFVVNLVEKL